jgi:hypothetical protein
MTILSSYLVLVGCEDIRPILTKTSQTRARYVNVKIKGDPYYEYRIRGIIERTLPSYHIKIDDYRISIELSETKSSVVYTTKQIAKDQIKVTASVTIHDKNFNPIATKKVDSYSTYEVCDDLPYADQASKKQATDSVLEDLANAIVLIIVSSVSPYEKDC